MLQNDPLLGNSDQFPISKFHYAFGNVHRSRGNGEQALRDLGVALGVTSLRGCSGNGSVSAIHQLTVVQLSTLPLTNPPVTSWS